MMLRNNNKEVRRNRRKFLKSIAGTTMIAGSIGFGSELVSAEEIGITEKIHQLIINGRVKQAKDLLESHDINHGYINGKKYPEDSSGIGTQSVFKKEPTNVHFFAYEQGAPYYNAEVTWDLSPHTSADSMQPNDVVAVTFNGARWQVNADTDIWNDYYIENKWTRPDGFTGKWDDEVAYVMNGDTSGYIGAMLEKSENYRGNKQNLWAHYKHTWVPPWKGGGAGAILAASDIGLAPGILSVDTFADTWNIRKGAIEI